MKRLKKSALCFVLAILMLSTVSFRSSAMLAVGDGTGTYPEEETSITDESGNIVGSDDGWHDLILSTVLPAGILVLTLFFVVGVTLHLRRKSGKDAEVPEFDSSEAPQKTGKE